MGISSLNTLHNNRIQLQGFKVNFYLIDWLIERQGYLMGKVYFQASSRLDTTLELWFVKDGRTKKIY